MALMAHNPKLTELVRARLSQRTAQHGEDEALTWSTDRGSIISDAAAKGKSQ
jgi:hypothetical protein